MSKTITVPLDVLENPVVSLQTKIVYCLIFSELKHNDEKSFIYDVLAVKCAMTRRQLTKSIKELVELKLLADHPSLYCDSICKEIRLGTVTDWSKVTEKPVKPKTEDRPKTESQPKAQGKPKVPDKVEK